MSEAATTWQPVARSAELRAGHDIVAAFVAGHELALWRSTSGSVQAWDNRCPHRSVRFTLGQVVGERLSCGYHGWQYEAVSGRCTAVPSHPEVAPPPHLCAQGHPVCESSGLVWVALGTEPAIGPPADAAPGGWVYCRNLPVRAGLPTVEAGMRACGWTPDGTGWQGVLGGVPARALLLAAQQTLSQCFLWIDAPAEGAPLQAAHADARRLRNHIEASL